MDYNLADLFEAVVDALPDDYTAVAAGDRHLSYRELDARSNRIAHHLAASGIGEGDHVGLYLYNGTEYLEGMLGCFKIRAIPVNVNYRYVEEELRYLFDDADLKAVIFNREFADRLDAIRHELPLLQLFVSVEDASGADIERLGATDYETALGAASPKRDFAPRSGDDIYILYTGGTTGMPKGVLWRQEDIFFAAMRGGNPMGEPIAAPEEIKAKATEKGMQMGYMIVPPLMHGAAQWAAFLAFFGGDKLIFDTHKKFEPANIWQLVNDETANTMVIVGDAMGRPLAEALDDAPEGTWDVSSLFILGSGGAILSDRVKEQLRAHFPNLLIVDSYGVSETGYQASRPSAAEADDGGGPRFVADDTTAVLDDNLERVAPGSEATGMLARSGHIPLGYYKDEAKSAKTFVTAPDGTRWSLPGDMAQVEADGTIVLLGRGSQSINSGGEKIYPEEVEAALKEHPDVFDALVVGVPDDRFGQAVAAVVAARAGSEPKLKELAKFASNKVAKYKLPRHLTLVDSVVRSPSGKPDYRWAKEVATKDAAGES